MYYAIALALSTSDIRLTIVLFINKLSVIDRNESPQFKAHTFWLS